MSNQLLCPLCSDVVDSSFTHFLKHFKYKKFSCGDAKCDKAFYTEHERNTHCQNTGHKRSFQKTVSPYLDMIVDLITQDAKLIANKDLEYVIEARKAAIQESTDVINGGESTSDLHLKKRRGTPQNTDNDIIEPSVKKTKKKSSSNVAESSIRNNCNDVVNEGNIGSFIDPTVSSILGSKSPVANDRIDNVSNVSRMSFYEATDDITVECNLCNKSVCYDYLVRKDHIAREHMDSNVTTEEYMEILNDKMNAAFLGLPNTDNACQLCMTGADIRPSGRREHIERKHGLKLPEISCPVMTCRIVFTRQCELGTHLREKHDASLSTYKDKDFQANRRRRNRFIELLTTKCFPMSQFKIANLTSKKQKNSPNVSSQSVDAILSIQESALSNAFEKDIRIREMTKTRRPDIYNKDCSSSDEENNVDVTNHDSADSGMIEDEPEGIEEDLIVISHSYNQEIIDKLKERNITIKSEPGLEESYHEERASDVMQTDGHEQQPIPTEGQNSESAANIDTSRASNEMNYRNNINVDVKPHKILSPEKLRPQTPAYFHNKYQSHSYNSSSGNSVSQFWSSPCRSMSLSGESYFDRDKSDRARSSYTSQYSIDNAHRSYKYRTAPKHTEYWKDDKNRERSRSRNQSRYVPKSSGSSKSRNYKRTA